MFELVILTLVTLGVLGYLTARRRVTAMAAEQRAHSHSLPDYHGTFVALWVGLPAFFLALVWLMLQDKVIEHLILASLPESVHEGFDDAPSAPSLREIRHITSGQTLRGAQPEGGPADRGVA